MLEEIHQSIVKGDNSRTVELIKQAIDSGEDSGVILKQAMIPAMEEVGRRFEVGEYFVPEMLVAARAMKQGMTIIKPFLTDRDSKPLGVVVAGTVRGDMHDIGKNLVCMMLEGAGFEIHDLGTNVPPAHFVEAVRTKHPDLVGLSALLTTTMPNLKATIEALVEAQIREGLIIMVGGAPVTKEYANNIGADGFAKDAAGAVTVAKSLLGV
jgi:5-methyltetrahydrofolate--homocysteine methyltransferase